MNEYRITYVVDKDETEQTYIIERTEAAARKLFKKLSGNREIAEVELTDTNAAATKEQERETLEKIKAMVAELGPQSYLATAFDGVFEDAEQNIEDDAAYSMKARLEIQAQRAIERGYEVDRLKADLSEAREQLAAAQKQTAALKRQQLPELLWLDLRAMVTDEAEASRARMAKAAHVMAACADNPDCVSFKESVADYRKEEKRIAVMEKRAAALNALEPKSE